MPDQEALTVDLPTDPGRRPQALQAIQELEAKLGQLRSRRAMPLSGPISLQQDGTLSASYPGGKEAIQGSTPPPTQRLKDAMEIAELLLETSELGLWHPQLDSSWLIDDGHNIKLAAMGLGNLLWLDPAPGEARKGDSPGEVAALLASLLLWEPMEEDELPRSAARMQRAGIPAEVARAVEELPSDPGEGLVRVIRTLFQRVHSTPLFFGFGIDFSKLPRWVGGEIGFKKEMQGRLRAARTLDGSGIELYSPRLRIYIRPDATDQRSLWALRVEEEPAESARRQQAFALPLNLCYHPSASGQRLIEEIDNPAGQQDLRSELDAWMPWRVAQALQQLARQGHRESGAFEANAVADRTDQPGEMLLKLSNISSASGNPLDDLSGQLSDLYMTGIEGVSGSLRGSALRWQGPNQLLARIDRGNTGLQRIRIIDRGANAIIERERQALEELQSGRGANPRLAEVLLDPRKARAGEPEVPSELFQDLSPPDKVAQLIGKILAAEEIFALQGPPGTGKTTTIVETVLQLLKRKPDALILVTSQTREATENALERLARQDGIRAWRDGRGEPSPDYLQWRRAGGHGSEAEYIMGTNLIGSTLLRLPAVLRNPDLQAMLRQRAFDLVIIDEAAKAQMAELLVAMQRGHRVLLVGDHRQLPPFLDDEDARKLRSQGFSEHDIKLSLFEALFEGTKGQAGQLPAHLRHTLDTQYRMPQQVGDAVSQAFYGGQLKTGTRPRPLPSDLDEDHRGLWLDIKGHEVNSGATDGPAWDNPDQLQAAMQALRALNRDASRPGAPQVDVAVICAYRGQVVRAQAAIALASRELSALSSKNPIKVGTVDGFQGQERDVVIYIMTRSPKNTAWVVDPQRVNVAMSRCRSLLIVVGDREASLRGPLGAVARRFSDPPAGWL